ncbi:zinc-ribbon domain-containing protein [Clostridium sp. UBA7503]|uniref:zinc-ribbon domain-containing protein n=1 Tax=Clostridium sp. UBA7503 TaxID=1946377 RepID=UPI0032172311
MMFCKNCGREIDNNAEICPLCGVRVKEAKSGAVDNPSHLAGVASCCFPIVGIILYFLWKDEKPKSAKTLCYWMIGGLVAWIVFYIICIVIGFASDAMYYY